MAERPDPVMAVRAAYGLALIAAPDAVCGPLADGDPVDRRVRWFARLLGARQLLEAALLVRDRGRAGRLAGAGVDALHGASVLWLARRVPARRHLLHANASVAGALALYGVARGWRAR